MSDPLIIKDVEKAECGCVATIYAKEHVAPKVDYCPQHRVMADAMLNITVLQKLVVWLCILSGGCPKHPAYRVKKKPIADCIDCKNLWGVREEVVKMQKNGLRLPVNLFSVSTKKKEDADV